MQLKYHMVTIEDLVPADHLLRKIDAALDFSFVYEETSGLYQRRYVRPPIDPVVMVKYLLAVAVAGAGDGGAAVAGEGELGPSKGAPPAPAYNFNQDKALDIYASACGHFSVMPKTDTAKLLVE